MHAAAGGAHGTHAGWGGGGGGGVHGCGADCWQPLLRGGTVTTRGWISGFLDLPLKIIIISNILIIIVIIIIYRIFLFVENMVLVELASQ